MESRFVHWTSPKTSFCTEVTLNSQHFFCWLRQVCHFEVKQSILKVKFIKTGRATQMQTNAICLTYSNRLAFNKSAIVWFLMLSIMFLSPAASRLKCRNVITLWWHREKWKMDGKWYAPRRQCTGDEEQEHVLYACRIVDQMEQRTREHGKRTLTII